MVWVRKDTGTEESNKKSASQIGSHFLLLKRCKLIQKLTEYFHCFLQSRASGRFQKCLLSYNNQLFEIQNTNYLSGKLC